MLMMMVVVVELEVVVMMMTFLLISHLLLLWRLKLSITIRALWWWACLIVNRTFEILLIVAVKAFYY
jgi:hypothetical protein